MIGNPCSTACKDVPLQGAHHCANTYVDCVIVHACRSHICDDAIYFSMVKEVHFMISGQRATGPWDCQVSLSIIAYTHATKLADCRKARLLNISEAAGIRAFLWAALARGQMTFLRHSTHALYAGFPEHNADHQTWLQLLECPSVCVCLCLPWQQDKVAQRQTRHMQSLTISIGQAA